jgi:hypothetical protein
MGLILDARCARCGFERTSLRLGATVAQMSDDRRSALHLFACRTCRDVAQVELFLGEPRGSPPCDRCGATLSLAREDEFRIAALSGNRLSEHACPACGERALAFVQTETFL